MKMTNLTFLLILILIFLLFQIYSLNFFIKKQKIDSISNNNIQIKNNSIIFSSLTTKQKIAQMIIIRGDNKKNLDLCEFNIGGIFLDKQKTKKDYIELIKSYQKKSKIKLFVTTDLEGAWNPFSNFIDFPKFSEIKTKEEAYEIGLQHGEILSEIGFNLNFAPVAELSDNSYGGRVFSGSKEEIKEKIISYIRGLQKKVSGTCKHYPGKALIKNLHNESYKEIIDDNDLELFKTCINENIFAIMIGHQIVEGKLASNNKPSSVSKEIISSLSNFDGLIISDEINMKGLSSYYNSKEEIYKDLINSGIDIILDFSLDSDSLYSLLEKLEEKIEKKEIKIEDIDKTVKKILIKKGYEII